MNRVFKYIIPSHFGGVVIKMPEGARVLSVQVQCGSPCMWALVDDQRPMVDRRFLVVGTGHQIARPEAWEFVGTFQMMDGLMVWHLFEEVV